MSKVEWQPTHDALTAALVNAKGTDLQIGRQLAHNLGFKGAMYDDLFTPQVAAAELRRRQAHAEEVTKWRAARSAALEQIDSVAMWAEGLQVETNTFSGHVVTIAGQRSVLAPTVKVPFSEDVEPVQQASTTIGGLHVVAREPGVFGNLVQVQIANHQPSVDQVAFLESQLEGLSGEARAPILATIARLNQNFRIRFTLGGYAETFEPMQPGSPVPLSLIVERVEWAPGATRPANTTRTLSGGTSRCLETVRQRLTRAASLPVLTGPQRAMVASYRAALEKTAGTPRPRRTWPDSPVYYWKRIEDEVVELVGQAKAFMAAL